jgi:Chaperone of endosialidase
MSSLTQLKQLTPQFVIAIVFASFAHLPTAQAVVPPPDGGYPSFTTAEGHNALFHLTTGIANTAVGWSSLFSDTDGSFNTAVGAGTLLFTDGAQSGAGSYNTANGAGALLFNTNGRSNTATGAAALVSNLSGSFNVADGDTALQNNTTGGFNTAVGSGALNLNTTSNDNTAVGAGALGTSSGGNNTAVGRQAGLVAGEGSNNVYIGSDMVGVADELNHTYIRNINTTSVSGMGTDTVTINLTTGLLGHATSSRRYKHDIKAMEDSSAALYQLKPVTFRYNEEIDHSQSLDYGLIAEDVAQVDPNLSVCDRNGKVESVRYTAINAMLLNEFLKEHNAFLQEQKKVRKLEAALATVNERLKEQDAKIEKVTAGIVTNTTAPQVVRVP